jgi:hypothetical protein
MAKPKLTRDQIETLSNHIVESPIIADKLEKHEYATLSKASWNKIFNAISGSIEYFVAIGDEDSQNWYRDLYGDVEKLMQYYHPTWKSPATLES